MKLAQHGKDSVPQSRPAEPDATIIDRIAAGTMSLKEVSDEIVRDAYGPLRLFCELPAGYHHCVLESHRRNIDTLSAEELDALIARPPGGIVDPEPAQLEAIYLLQLFMAGDPSVCKEGDPFRPLFGANFFGPPGCGKTHLQAAFALRMKLLLEVRLEKYRRMVHQFVVKEYGNLVKKTHYGPKALKLDLPENPTEADKLLDSLKAGSGGGMTLLEAAGKMSGERMEVVSTAELRQRFLAALATFRQSLLKLENQPTDLLYLTFDQLFDLCRADAENRQAAVDALAQAKLVFIDDVHPKGDPERAQIVQSLIEERYAVGRMGTFITTNLTTDQIGGEDARIVSRLKSRCSEMFYEIDFTGCIDWRVKVMHRRLQIVKDALQARIKRPTPMAGFQTSVYYA